MRKTKGSKQGLVLQPSLQLRTPSLGRYVPAGRFMNVTGKREAARRLAQMERRKAKTDAPQ